MPDGLEEISKFVDIIDCIRYRNLNMDDIIYIDLKKVSFISPYGLLGLLLIGRYLYELTGEKSHIIDSKDKLIQYLERMDFFKIGTQWFHTPSILKKVNYKYARSSKTDSLLEIQEIGSNTTQGKSDVDSIILKFRQRALAILDDFQKRMNIDFFIKIIAELCTNVYTHSQSNGYVAIQRYNYEKRGYEVVKLSVMDYGIGIKNSLEKRYNFKFDNEVDYLKKSLEPNISGAGDRGFGLYEVKDIVENSLGYLWINSGQSSILIDSNKKPLEYTNLPFLNGTRIAIILAFENITFPLDIGQSYILNF
jgi:hypothetical protein